MSLTNVESAMNVQLASSLSAYTVVFENTGTDDSGPYRPGVDEVYAEQYFLPGRPVTIGVGQCTQQRYLGIYQVTVDVPAYKGKVGSDEVVRLLEAGFALGTPLTYDGVSVRCREIYTGTPRTENGRYRLPVNIRFQSDI